ncbi:peptidoglycan DD-metalloendopeptidase family protein [Acetobacterium wieringae]|uniref:peptidoglycan DD-metalloendopeptidase family protein n=1 Tax=Acetobacterium wieringae TaxID=52694 RepID=UPI003158AF2C
MAYDIGLKIGIDGEAEFQKSIRNINEEYKTLKTEMASVTSAFDKNDQSQEKLTKQNEVLTKQIDLQKKKIEECNAALEKAKDKYGDNDRVTQSWQRAVNTATTELNKLERGLETNNAVLVKHNSKLKDLSNASNDAKEKIGAMGDGMASAGSKMTAGITVPAAAAIAGLSALVMKSVGTADEMQRLSDVTGISAEELQKLNYAGSALGVQLETVTGAQAKLTKSMAGATDGTGTQAEAFATLGVSILDSNGNMRDANTVMMESFDALNGVGNETERDALAMAIFGKSAMELNPLIKAGSAGLKELTDEAEANGSVISNEGVAALDTFGDSLDAMGLSIMGAVGSVAADFTPTLQELADVAKDDIVPAIAGIVKGAGDLIVGFTELDPTLQKVILGTAGIALAAGPVMSVVGNVTSVIGGAVGAFGTLSGAIGVMTTGAVAATPAIAGTATALTVLTGPIGIVVGALALLTAGGVALHEVMAKGKQLTEEQIKANDAFIASSTAVAGAVTANITSRSDSIKASQDEAVAAQELSQKLFDLAEKQNKSGAEMQLLTSYVDQFNQLMPNANLLIDEQTGALNMTREATNELIAAETERIQKQAVNEAQVQNAKDQLATRREMNEAENRAIQLQNEYRDALQPVIDGTGTANEKQQKANELWAKYQEQLGPVKESISTLTAKQGDLNTEQSTLNGLLQDPSGWNAYITGVNTAQSATVTFADGSTKKIEEFGTTAPILMAQTGTNSAIALQNSLIAGTPGITAAAQGAHDTVKTTTDPLVPELAKTGDDGAHGLGQSILNQQPWIKTNSQLAHDTVNDTTKPLVEELTKTGSDSGYGLGGGLGSQNQYVGINAQLIHNTTKETTDPLVEELTDTGSDSGQGLGDGLESKNFAVGTSAQLVSDNAKSKFSPLPGVIGGYGGDSGQGYADGLKSKEGEIEGKSNSLVQKVLTTFKTALGIQSPSKEFRKIGEDSMDGFLDGLSAENMIAFANGIVEDIKEAFANKKFSLQGAVEFIGSGAMEFLKSIGVGGASMGDLTSPLSGSITSEFGTRADPFTGEQKFHAGIDIGAAEGTPVGAAGAGTVTMAGWYGGYGNAVMIDHGNGLESLYGHLSAIMVSVGDLVTQLQTIGLVGSTGNSTGPHLHFELRQDGTPIDPSALFGFDIGTRYVPRDMVAMIHEGEMIVPKKENPYANSGGSITGGLGQGITQNVHIYSPTYLSPAQISKQSKYALRDMILSL